MTKKNSLMKMARQLRDIIAPDIPDDQLEEAITDKFGSDGVEKMDSLLDDPNINYEILAKQAEENLNDKIRKKE